jgi:hypothetical protein
MAEVADGERVQITVVKQSPSGPGFAPQWRLLTGAGTPAAGCGYFNTHPLLDCGPLPASGNPYQIEVIDNYRDATGSYAVHVYKLRAATACDTGTVSCGVPVTGTIEPAIDSDMMSLPEVNDGERVRIRVVKQAPSGPAFAPQWRLLTGAGTPAAACGYFNTHPRLDCGPLPAFGNPYQIEVIDNYRDATGAYEVAIEFIGRTCTSPNPDPGTRLVVDAPADPSVGLNVSFRWHLENAEPGLTYEFEVLLDKGTEPCDGRIEESIDAGAGACVTVDLDPRRYSGQNADFAVRSTDSLGRSLCARGPRLFFDSQRPPAQACSP